MTESLLGVQSAQIRLTIRLVSICSKRSGDVVNGAGKDERK